MKERSDYYGYLKELRNNNEAIIHTLYKKIQPIFRRWVLKNSGTHADAEDTFSEALTILYLKAQDDSFALKTTIDKYLLGIAKYLWLKKINVKKKEEKVRKELFDKRTSERERNDVFEDLEEINNLRLQYIPETFKKLSPLCQKILDHLENKKTPVKEVAKLFDMTENAVYVRRHRCLNRWRQLIEDKTDSK